MGQTFITPDNLTPVVQILTWFLLITAFLGYLTRGGTKIAMGRKIALDDFLISASMILLIAQSMSITISTLNGFGKPLHASTVNQLHADLKSAYASNFLYSLGLAFSKTTVLALIWNVTLDVRDRWTILTVGSVIVVWTITSQLVFGFQCDLPRPWDIITNSCIDLTAWWNFFEAMNLITDLALIAIPFPIIATLKMDLSRRISILTFFSARFLVVAAIICKLVYQNIDSNTTDFTLNLWSVAICTQVIQALSFLAACILYMKPFWDSLQPGWLVSDDLRRRGLSDQWGHYSSSDGKPSKELSRRGSKGEEAQSSSTSSRVANSLKMLLT